MIHEMPYTHHLIRGAPHLFFEQFDSATWLFLTLVGADHWILVVEDLKNIKIDMYNSLGHDTDTVYQDLHKLKIRWLRVFLAWRTGKSIWFFFSKYNV
jgi:hypothetical protein